MREKARKLPAPLAGDDPFPVEAVLKIASGLAIIQLHATESLAFPADVPRVPLPRESLVRPSAVADPAVMTRQPAAPTHSSHPEIPHLRFALPVSVVRRDAVRSRRNSVIVGRGTLSQQGRGECSDGTRRVRKSAGVSPPPSVFGRFPAPSGIALASGSTGRACCNEYTVVMRNGNIRHFRRSGGL